MALEHDAPLTRHEENLRQTQDNGTLVRATVLKLNDKPKITYLHLMSTDSRIPLEQRGWDVNHVRQLHDFLTYLLANVLTRPDTPVKPAIPDATATQVLHVPLS